MKEKMLLVLSMIGLGAAVGFATVDEIKTKELQQEVSVKNEYIEQQTKLYMEDIIQHTLDLEVLHIQQAKLKMKHEAENLDDVTTYLDYTQKRLEIWAETAFIQQFEQQFDEVLFLYPDISIRNTDIDVKKSIIDIVEETPYYLTGKMIVWVKELPPNETKDSLLQKVRETLHLEKTDIIVEVKIIHNSKQ